MNDKTMNCNLCWHHCNIDRAVTTGRCGLDRGIYVSYRGPHFGEEPFLIGDKGSGAVFFMGCNLRCVFCQNHQISRWTVHRPLPPRAETITSEELAEVFLEFQDRGLATVNLVSPTPHARGIARALETAKRRGLALPVVYNTHGYDAPEALDLMNGLVDVYLPDMKYGSDPAGERCSGIPGYWTRARETLQIMFEQTGHLRIGENGIAIRGMSVRHLVLPGDSENSFEVLDFLATFGRKISVSLMAQYHPLDGPCAMPPGLDRTLTQDEYDRVVDYALGLGLENCLVQELDSHCDFLPDFDRKDSFSGG
ncbi:MAG TPA: radical SAM protein [Spirochaetota bacterium]|nr:radical SAM protein [Spirochaetota bacterium]HPI90813.1 radical SAM protein [Spirochaetota bacterium]HPR47635.1 radical SAM protein [Spirochaetota bacterium]